MVPPNEQWEEDEDVALTKAWVESTLSKAHGDARWNVVALRVPRRSPEACRSRWTRVLRPDLQKFDLCVDAARDAYATTRRRAFEQAVELFYVLTDGQFPHHRCWDIWDVRPATASINDEENAVTSAWTKDGDEALCRSWIRVMTGKSASDVALYETRKSVWESVARGLKGTPWQNSFFRWREIKRACREFHEGAVSEDDFRFKHCYTFLKARPEFQVERPTAGRSKKRRPKGSLHDDSSQETPLQTPQGTVTNAAEPVKKRGRGRPRKHPLVTASTIGEVSTCSADQPTESQQKKKTAHDGQHATMEDAQVSEPQEQTTAESLSSGEHAPTGPVDVIGVRQQSDELRLELLKEQKRSNDVAEEKNRLLEMQLGMQLFSQTLPPDKDGREYFTLMRQALLHRARKSARALEREQTEQERQKTT